MISNSQPLSKCPLYITSIFENERIGLKSYAKQAEAEVVPSSSLAEVEFEVEVGVEVDVGVEVGVEVGVDVGVEVEVGVGAGGVMVGAGLTFSVGWVGGWRFGE